jgi:hypothetical protein
MPGPAGVEPALGAWVGSSPPDTKVGSSTTCPSHGPGVAVASVAGSVGAGVVTASPPTDVGSAAKAVGTTATASAAAVASETRSLRTAGYPVAVCPGASGGSGGEPA